MPFTWPRAFGDYAGIVQLGGGLMDLSELAAILEARPQENKDYLVT
jgi:hypothetical protein